MKPLAVCVLWAALCVTAVPCQQPGRAPSIDGFRQAFERDSKSEEAAFNLALALLEGGRAAEALAILERRPPAAADSFALRGAVLNALGRPEEAAEALRRAVALDGNNSDTLYDLALTLLKADRVPEAAELLERGRRRFPKVAKLHAVSGAIAYAKGKYDESIAFYQAAVRLEPGGADFQASLGDVYDATGKLSEAQGAYAAAVRLDSSVSAYHVKQGRNLLKLQRTGEAKAAFERALARNASDADACFQLGKLAASASDHGTAIRHLERAVALEPGLKEAWYQLSLSYRRAGEEDKSRAAMEQSRRLP